MAGDRTAPSTRSQGATRDRPEPVPILLEEYRALYALAQFRMGSLERRAPIAGAMLSAFLGSVTILPPEASLIFLLGLPLALLWFVRTTVIHAKSFADILRRIEAIESRVNEIAGDELMLFQSTHPSRRLAVGGRIGREVTRSVVIGCLMLLAGCVYLFSIHHGTTVAWGLPLYLGYAVAASLLMIREVAALTRYQPQSNTPPCDHSATNGKRSEKGSSRS